MEFVLELLLEILAEVFFDGLFDRAGRQAARAVKRPAVRIALLAGVAIAVGLVGGALWGAYATEQLGGATPRSLWVALGSGLLALAVAAGVHPSRDERFASTTPDEPRTASQRFAAIGAFNLVIAAGIALGAAG